MAVVVVATIRPVPDRRAEAIAAVKETVAQVHAEDDGCLLYALHEGPDRLVLIEKWTDAEALAAHGRGAAVASIPERMKGLVTGPSDVQVLHPHPAGNPEQGIL